MRYCPPLQRGRLIRRYKRFLADVETDTGDRITIHCPNTGSMKNCAHAGDEVWYSVSENEKRKYPNTWELTRTKRGHYIGINTGSANRLVKAAIEDNVVDELKGYPSLVTEERYGKENSRIDIKLSGHVRRADCYVEVKSVTLLEAPVSAGVGYFPDAVSARGAKHLRELTEIVAAGFRGVLLYCVQHSGIREVRPARHIDPVYATTLDEAVAQGVEVLAYKTRMSPKGLRIVKSIPVALET
ncbi:MAG TPA: DNA/RNA nuclease SfsA [Pseudomonadales bacterium]|nr:DNA/RNA nuclease SfsA [Pseudomonadales bacterium]